MGKKHLFGKPLFPKITIASRSEVDFEQGTVLFAANLGFLSIQSVDNGHVAARALGFLSIFTACNSTVTSFAFARHFKVKDMGNMCDAVGLLSRTAGMLEYT